VDVARLSLSPGVSGEWAKVLGIKSRQERAETTVMIPQEFHNIQICLFSR